MSAGERDREVAEALVAQVHSGWCIASPGQPNPHGHPCHCRAKGVADAIAEAIAAERERVLAPVRALAEELDHDSNDPPAEYAEGAYADSADRLRAVLPPADTEDGQR